MSNYGAQGPNPGYGQRPPPPQAPPSSQAPPSRSNQNPQTAPQQSQPRGTYPLNTTSAPAAPAQGAQSPTGSHTPGPSRPTTPFNENEPAPPGAAQTSSNPPFPPATNGAVTAAPRSGANPGPAVDPAHHNAVYHASQVAKGGFTAGHMDAALQLGTYALGSLANTHGFAPDAPHPGSQR